MKKLFTLIILFTAAATAFAQEVLWTGESVNGAGIDIPAEKFADATIGSKLLFDMQYTGEQGKAGPINSTAGEIRLLQYNTQISAKTSIIFASQNKLDKVKAEGFKFTSTDKQFKIYKISLVKEWDKILWQGESVVRWGAEDHECLLPYTFFQDFVTSDVLLIKVNHDITGGIEANYGTMKILQNGGPTWDMFKTIYQADISDANEEGYIPLTIDSDALALLKAGGMRISGDAGALIEVKVQWADDRAARGLPADPIANLIATDIKNHVINTDIDNSPVYNINGIKVADKLSEAKLKTGVYVVKGKKFVVK